jgi:hypothetical protein
MRPEAIENPPFVMPIAGYSYLFPDASNSPFRASTPVAEQMRELDEGIDLSPEPTSKTFVLIAEQIRELYQGIDLSPEPTSKTSPLADLF